MIIASLDPGKWVLPICFWEDGKLTHASMSVLASWPRAKAEHIACAHMDKLQHMPKPDRVYIEQLSLNTGRDRTRGKAIATGNDLLMLTSIAALVAGHLGAPVTYLPVNTWKGSAPKEVTRARVLSTLDARELDVLVLGLRGVRKSLHHNLYDACGIGLHATGRYRIRGAKTA